MLMCKLFSDEWADSARFNIYSCQCRRCCNFWNLWRKFNLGVRRRNGNTDN
ncbi:MAG: hypothetical protein K2H93_05035 [Oscillospiraceae bacterium]|nr:hypothetical protein [Oscillospiraceae bacterium]